MTLILRYAVRSDVGLLREGNEDSAYAGPRLLAVADGMGGHAAGEVASAVTIASMAELDSAQPGGDMLEALSAAVSEANARLQEMIIANPAVEGMGTTLTALFWSDGHAAVCHIGDSRGYLLREGELYQITHDHTLVQSLVDEGRISADDVSTHPQRSLLLRALDGRSVAEPDLSVHESQANDRYLLCSDGLSGVVSDETLRETLATVTEPEACTRQLIELALHGGGPDNITCIVADVVDAATANQPATRTPVLAGAAANVGDPRFGADGTVPSAPAGPDRAAGDHEHLEDQEQPSLTAPVSDGDLRSMPFGANGNGTGPRAVKGAGSVRGRGGHRGQRRRAPSRRRWPIVTTALVVLLAVVVGGGYIAWRVSQNQYYVAADSHGNVVIYRGINERILGVDLSSPYRATAITLAQVPSNYQQTVRTAYASGSLTEVQKTVDTIRSAVNQCKQQYTRLRDWAAAMGTYQAQLAQAKKNNNNKLPKNFPKPPPQPASAGATCASSQAFGIQAGALHPSGSS
jgi:serine/threonine protein phosphatase PrpC